MKFIGFSKRGRRFVPIVLSLFFALLLVMPSTLHAFVTVTADNPSNNVGATVTVTVTSNEAWSTAVHINIVDGPNAPYEADIIGSFDPSWNVVGTFTYEGTGGAGVDTIEAYVNWNSTFQSMGSTTVEWIDASPKSPTFDLVVRPKLNVNSRGVLSITVCGSSNFDVNSIDPDSVQLMGVPAVRHAYEDAQGACGGADGVGDLILKFKTRDIAEALGDVVDGEDRTLTFSGTLTDGTPLEAAFEMTMINKGKHKKGKKEKKEKKEKKGKKGK